jgi:hypothetical protein
MNERKNKQSCVIAGFAGREDELAKEKEEKNEIVVFFWVAFVCSISNQNINNDD